MMSAHTCTVYCRGNIGHILVDCSPLFRGSAIPKVHYFKVPVTDENDSATATFAVVAWSFSAVTGISASDSWECKRGDSISPDIFANVKLSVLPKHRKTCNISLGVIETIFVRHQNLNTITNPNRNLTNHTHPNRPRIICITRCCHSNGKSLYTE